MSRRSRLTSVLVGTLLIGCTDARGAAPDPEPSPAEVADDVEARADPADRTDPADPADPADRTDPADRADPGVPAGPKVSAVAEEPAVPPLHADVDTLDETVVTIETRAGAQVRVDAKVATTHAERRRGLMHVEELPAGTGMLFLFDEARTGGFWMRDTLVPLDIAYIDGTGTITTLLAMEPCEARLAADCPVYAPDEPYVTALEVPGGWFDDVGVDTGARLRWQPPRPPAGAQ